MKKALTLLLTLLLSVTLALSLTACGGKNYEGKIAIYMPDGAPALAFSKLMHDENKLDKDLTYTVVEASTIQVHVARETAAAALMPVNAAVKLCGTGEKYKMVSVNTHGNLFILGKTDANSVTDLKGKTVVVTNLPNVPGLTLKAILRDANIAFTENAAEKTSENVLLVGADAGNTAAQKVKTGLADFAVVPEPAATNLSSKLGLTVALSMQELWGEDGYPQAVLVVKKELAEDTKFIKNLLDALGESAEWVTTHGTEAVAAIAAHFEEGKATTLNAAALSSTAITNSNVKVVKAKEMKSAVKDYMSKINAVGASSFGEPADAFFA